MNNNTTSFKPILLEIMRQGQRDMETFVQGLSSAEREAFGTPELWAARDHLAHMTFWQGQLLGRLRFILKRGPKPASIDYVEANPQIFEENRLRLWSEVLQEYKETSDAVIHEAEELSEEDLTTPGRFEWLDGNALYASFMGNCYAHAFDHYAQYYADRHDMARAIETYEHGVQYLVQTGAPDALRGSAVYNLACYYATHGRLKQAASTLAESLELDPTLKAWSLEDPDLVALRA